MLYENFDVETTDKVLIKGFILLPSNKPKGIVIICHPFGLNKSRTLAHADFLVKADIVAIVFDHRSCGESHSSISPLRDNLWGPLKDLEAVANFTSARFKNEHLFNNNVALMGLSFGGNISLVHATQSIIKYKALIFDSTPLTRYESYIRNALLRKSSHRSQFGMKIRKAVHAIPVWIIAWLSRSEALFQSAIRSANRLTVTPILLIIGRKDSYFNIEDACDFLHKYYSGPKEIWKTENGRHMTNHLKYPNLYKERVLSFLLGAFGENSLCNSTG